MVKFYRGLYSNYKYDKTTKTGKHLDCIYFATDVGKILMNGIEFSSSTVDTSKFDAAIKGVTISNNVLTFIPVEGSPFTVTIPTATSTTNGVMSSADKSKLDGIESGAQKNTITGVKGGSESTYRTGNINITKTNIGLGNVDNTSDANKPISTAQQTALDKKVDKVPGKGLSTNDYTTEDKNKLSGIAAGATANEGTITGIKMNGVSKGTSGIVDLGTVITSHQDISGKLNVSLKGAANGLAELDSNGKVPSSQLPSYVDDVLEYSSKSVFPTTGESGKIYIDTTTNLSYRWGGTTYVEISPSLALGETSSTAYRGDRGKTAYDHSQSTHARTDATKVEKSSTNGNIKINGTETTVYTHPSGTNPHGTTKSDVGLGNVGNFKAVSTVASQGLTDTEKANARANIGAGTSSFSGSYNDLSNKPNIPAVGNGTITITQNGVTKGTFTTNQSGNTTIALTDTDTNTTYGVATSSSLGLVKSGTDITVDSSGNVSVNDDSHNHVISNVDGLQSALDGKAASSHGNHVPTTQAANNAVFLRNDNTWQTVTPANIGAAASGHTHNYAGSSSSGGDATRAIAVADYGNTANTIQIGFSGAGATTSNLSYIAGYLSGGTQIKDVSKDTLKEWIGLGSAAYTNSSTYAAASHTHSYLPLAGGTMTGALTVQTGGVWVQGGSAAGGDNSRMTTTSGMPTELAYNTSRRGTRIYSNAIAFADPYHGNTNNDAGWIRHLETTANEGAFEIAVGDDGNESIVVRQYNTSNSISREAYLLNGSGNSSFPGTVTASAFSGNASSASKWAAARTITLAGAVTGSANVDGSANVTLTTAVNHTHNYAGSSSAGGAATSANKVANALTLQFNGTTNQTYDGSAAKTFNVTPAAIGAAASSHSHDDRYYTESETNNLLNTKLSLAGGTMTGGITFSSLSGTNGRALLSQQMADNDFFRIYVGGTDSNAGYAEIATADDGNEPIYVRQYTGVFSTLVRTLTLLDGSGNSSFPGTVTAPSFSGNASTASKWANARTLTLTGSVTGSTSIDGSGNVTLTTTTNHTHTGAQVTMSGYSTLSGGYVTTSDTVNSAVHKIEDQLLWYELN